MENNDYIKPRLFKLYNRKGKYYLEFFERGKIHYRYGFKTRAARKEFLTLYLENLQSVFGVRTRLVAGETIRVGGGRLTEYIL